MIPHDNDLAPNDRTYLAWTRTSLSLIAFGFLLEKFDLLARYFAVGMPQGKLPQNASHSRKAGIILVALGLLVMLLSTGTLRHHQTPTQEQQGRNLCHP
jgi:putative membrane protein